jgi:hypothetical protein
VNALHKCSHVPVELLRGLHKGNVSTMIVIDARDMRDMASNIVRGGGQDNLIVFPLDNQRGDLDRLQDFPFRQTTPFWPVNRSEEGPLAAVQNG